MAKASMLWHPSDHCTKASINDVNPVTRSKFAQYCPIHKSKHTSDLWLEPICGHQQAVACVRALYTFQSFCLCCGFEQEC